MGENQSRSPDDDERSVRDDQRRKPVDVPLAVADPPRHAPVAESESPTTCAPATSRQVEAEAVAGGRLAQCWVAGCGQSLAGGSNPLARVVEGRRGPGAAGVVDGGQGHGE